MSGRDWFILVGVWGILALVTALNEVVSDPSDASGSSASAIAAINLGIAGETVDLDTPTFQGTTSNPIDTGFGLPKSPVGWLDLTWSALTIQSSIWEGWAALIAWVGRLFMAVIGIKLGWRGLEMASSVFGGPFGRSSP